MINNHNSTKAIIIDVILIFATGGLWMFGLLIGKFRKITGEEPTFTTCVVDTLLFTITLGIWGIYWFVKVLSKK